MSSARGIAAAAAAAAAAALKTVLAHVVPDGVAIFHRVVQHMVENVFCCRTSKIVLAEL